MKINIKLLLIVLLLLGIIALFIWGDKLQTGSIFAGIAAFIAALKSKLFGKNLLKEQILEIDLSHQLKREEWEKEKIRNQVRYEMLRFKIDSLESKEEELKEKLKDPKNPTKSRTEEEILYWLNKK